MQANRQDVQEAEQRGLPDVLLDRLRLRPEHLEALRALCASTNAALPDATRPGETRLGAGDIRIRQVPKPLGVVLMIYEARPTVTVEGALISVTTGNAVMLRGGREIATTNRALHTVITTSLQAAGLPPTMAQVLDDADRSAVRELLRRSNAIDALIPRGSPGLIDYCRSNSTIPVIASGGGVNHLYIHRSADLKSAASIALDSELPEPTACNTLELILVDETVAPDLVRVVLEHGHATGGFTLRLSPELAGDHVSSELVRIDVLSEHDNGREFLDHTLAIRPVAGLADALEHIRRHGSQHTEGIAATDPTVIRRFSENVDAAAIVVNGSLRLHDGPTMRLGPEISISTGRLHVRGPVNLSAMLTHSWEINGAGALRAALS